jgi:hypothetical protein
MWRLHDGRECVMQKDTHWRGDTCSCAMAADVGRAAGIWACERMQSRCPAFSTCGWHCSAGQVVARPAETWLGFFFACFGLQGSCDWFLDDNRQHKLMSITAQQEAAVSSDTTRRVRRCHCVPFLLYCLFGQWLTCW